MDDWTQLDTLLSIFFIFGFVIGIVAGMTMFDNH